MPEHAEPRHAGTQPPGPVGEEQTTQMHHSSDEAALFHATQLLRRQPRQIGGHRDRILREVPIGAQALDAWPGSPPRASAALPRSVTCSPCCSACGFMSRFAFGIGSRSSRFDRTKKAMPAQGIPQAGIAGRGFQASHRRRADATNPSAGVGADCPHLRAPSPMTASCQPPANRSLCKTERSGTLLHMRLHATHAGAPNLDTLVAG